MHSGNSGKVEINSWYWLCPFLLHRQYPKIQTHNIIRSPISRPTARITTWSERRERKQEILICAFRVKGKTKHRKYLTSTHFPWGQFIQLQPSKTDFLILLNFIQAWRKFSSFLLAVTPLSCVRSLFSKDSTTEIFLVNKYDFSSALLWDPGALGNSVPDGPFSPLLADISLFWSLVNPFA